MNPSEMLELYNKHRTLRKVAQLLNTTHETVRKELIKSGHYHPRITRAKRDKSIITDYTTRYDMTVKEIADKHYCSVQHVYDVTIGYQRAVKPIGCERCDTNPYAKGLCRRCYERQLRQEKKLEKVNS